MKTRKRLVTSACAAVCILVLGGQMQDSTDDGDIGGQEFATEHFLKTTTYSSSDLATLVDLLQKVPDWDRSLLIANDNRQTLFDVARRFQQAQPNLVEAAINAFTADIGRASRALSVVQRRRERHRPMILLRIMFELPEREMVAEDRRSRTRDMNKQQTGTWTVAGGFPARSVDGMSNVPQSLAMPFSWNDDEPNLIALPIENYAAVGEQYQPAYEYRYFLANFRLRQLP